MSLGKRRHVGLLPPVRKKRKIAPAIEEITFDATAREDYLCGFHKRKLQRIKHAKEEAMKREREERITARKLPMQLREGRRANLEKHVEAVNSMLREDYGDATEASEHDESMGEQQWNGIGGSPTVAHEDEYLDEEKFTTVTVETVEVSKDGLHKIVDGVGEDAAAQENEQRAKEALYEIQSARNVKEVQSKEPPRNTRKKKKFRYESKAERKVTRQKERSGSKAKAKLRRS
ncbi:MAG: hypothetical protein Q9217_005292 [Psora testacea]